MAEVKVAKRILTELDSNSFVDVDTYNTHTASVGNGAHIPSTGTDGHFLAHDGSFKMPPLANASNAGYLNSADFTKLSHTFAKYANTGDAVTSGTVGEVCLIGTEAAGWVPYIIIDTNANNS